MFSVEGTTQMTLTLGFKAASARMTPSIVALVLHFFHAVCGLDGDAPSVKRDGLADKPNDRPSGLRIRRIVSDHNHAWRFGTTLSDAKQRAHLEVGDFLFIQNFDGKAGFLAHGFGFLGEDSRREFVGRLVDEVTRKILRVGDDAAFRKTFLSGSALRVGIARDRNGFDVFVVLFIRLVFVGFEIGSNRTLDNRLRVFSGRVALTNEECKVLDGATF